MASLESLILETNKMDCQEQDSIKENSRVLKELLPNNIFSHSCIENRSFKQKSDAFLFCCNQSENAESYSPAALDALESDPIRLSIAAPRSTMHTQYYGLSTDSPSSNSLLEVQHRQRVNSSTSEPTLTGQQSFVIQGFGFSLI